MEPNSKLLLNSTAVVMHGCDRYLNLYPGFEFFFRKFWPTDIPVKLYLVTEEADYESAIFETIKSGTGEWADRLSRSLSQIPEDYIIYFQEDFWLFKPFPREVLESLAQLESLIGEPVKLLKLHGGYDS